MKLRRATPKDDRDRVYRPCDPHSRASAPERAEFPVGEFRLLVEKIRREDPAFTRRFRLAFALQALGCAGIVVGALTATRSWREPARAAFQVFCVGLMWWTTRWAFPTGRLELIRKAMLLHRRCPSCAYKLVELPVGADGWTVCPECGAAWKLDVPEPANAPATEPLA